MENKENAQVVYFMQNLSNKMDLVSKKIEFLNAKPTSKENSKIDFEIDWKPILDEFKKLFENDEIILKNIRSTHQNKKESPINNYYKKIINYSLFQSEFFKKHLKKIFIAGTVLLLFPSIYFYFQKKVLERKYQDYEIFYNYMNLLSLEQKLPENLIFYRGTFKNIKNRNDSLMLNYYKLKDIYVLK